MAPFWTQSSKPMFWWVPLAIFVIFGLAITGLVCILAHARY